MNIFTCLLLIGAYIVGAIPTGFLVARYAGVADITKHGSGNIGATNVARIAGKHYFLMVFLFDAAKAFLYLFLLDYYQISTALLYIMAGTLLIGNGISIFLGGKGGKGIATAAGILAFFNSKLLLALVCFWLASMIKTRNVGISSVWALCMLPTFVFIAFPVMTDFFLLCVFISCWGIWRHATNIKQFFQTLSPAS